jgi:hypothetical protein
VPEDITMPDKPSGQGETAPASPGSELPPTPGEAGQGGGSGSWPKELQAEMTRMRQADSERYEAQLQERAAQIERDVQARFEERLQREVDVLRNERHAPEPKLPDGVDLQSVDAVYRETRAYKEQQEALELTRRQLRQQAISGELLSVRDKPLFRQLEPQMRQTLQCAEEVQAGAGEHLYRHLAHDILVKDVEEKASENAKLREEKRQQLEQSNAASSGGEAASGYTGMFAEERKDVGEKAMEAMQGLDNDEFRSVIGELGKHGG